MRNGYDGLVLFSGGLDSLLSARLLMEQGLKILCLHFYTPFFGNPRKIPWWTDTYGLEIEAIDASIPFLEMFASYPEHGTGKNLNPCIDCKITLLKLAKERLAETGAKFVATGEVLGQRPMSQRTEALNIISKKSGVADILLRPLCAKHLKPTAMEDSGLVGREKLLDFSGRGRNGQLSLAARMGITEIPTPAGGCKLTEHENARRYWQILAPWWHGQAKPDAASQLADFNLANLGRVLFNDAGAILCIGRNESDNAKILAQRKQGDLLLRLPFPGPLALIRPRQPLSDSQLKDACAILASYAAKARLAGRPVPITVNGQSQIAVEPGRESALWTLPGWPETEAALHELRRARAPKPADKPVCFRE